MNTQEGANTCVVGIKGNFDDAQSAVKSIFTDKALEQELAAKGFQFSSANSINIGRLVPQIVYYFWAYLQAVRMGEIKNGEALNFTVPTGNFGDILAGWYAMKMGLPVGISFVHPMTIRCCTISSARGNIIKTEPSM